MCQVVLIRPGATVFDEQNRVQGVLDIPLSARGQREVAGIAKTLVQSFDRSPLCALYCGPGEHVVNSAEIIGKALGIRPKRIENFRNLNQGLWQGLQIEEIKRRNTKLFRQWIEDPETICPPQGETVEGAMERIKTAFKPLLRRHVDESIGLVVGEPLAGLVACYLKCEPRVHLDEQRPRCRFELIPIAPMLRRNGSG
jgi:broad specificity phosphatase PhoE